MDIDTMKMPQFVVKWWNSIEPEPPKPPPVFRHVYEDKHLPDYIMYRRLAESIKKAFSVQEFSELQATNLVRTIAQDADLYNDFVVCLLRERKGIDRQIDNFLDALEKDCS